MDLGENQSSGLWYDHPPFKEYCQNYNEMKNWFSTYLSAVSEQPTQPTPQDYRSTATDISSDENDDDESYEISSYENDDDESYEMVLNDEMIAFMEISQKHRQQLKLQRQEDDKKYQVINEKIDRSQPPAERPGTERTTEMMLLYGNDAAKIQGMETAMQLNFDRNCDLYHPKLWPNIPLKM